MQVQKFVRKHYNKLDVFEECPVKDTEEYSWHIGNDMIGIYHNPQDRGGNPFITNFSHGGDIIVKPDETCTVIYLGNRSCVAGFPNRHKAGNNELLNLTKFFKEQETLYEFLMIKDKNWIEHFEHEEDHDAILVAFSHAKPSKEFYKSWKTANIIIDYSDIMSEEKLKNLLDKVAWSR